MISLLVVDCDGTLTDCTVYVSERGEEMVAFNRRDGHAFQLCREHGIDAVILTGEDSPIVRKRAEKLRIAVCTSKDKTADVVRLGLGSGMAYIGDDVNDAAAMCMVRDAGGVIACPADAHRSVLNLRGVIVMPSRGGRGAVRDFVDMLIQERR